MSEARSERLMKLLIMLLVQERFVGKDKIREALYADDSDEGFERKFERDKDELRSLGVPIEVGNVDAYFDDVQGYRVRPGDFALPEIELTPAEAAVLRIATQMWQSSRLAEATRDGVRKLTAGGAPLALGVGDASDLGVRIPQMNADEPSFDEFVEAAHIRCEVVFDYQGTGDAAPRKRRLQPWSVVRYGGRWYVVGADPTVKDGDPQRVFRLSRVRGAAKMTGRRDAFEPPEVDARSLAARIAPPPPSGEPAELLIRTGAGFALRRDAIEVETDVAGPGGTHDPGAWDRVRLPWSGPSVVRTVLEHGSDVVVLAPPALRAEVVAALRQTLAEHQTGRTTGEVPLSVGEEHS